MGVCQSTAAVPSVSSPPKATTKGEYRPAKDDSVFISIEQVHVVRKKLILLYVITGTLSTSDGSSPRNVHWPPVVNGEVDVIPVKRAKPEHIKKGYSSGASSFSSGESEKQSKHHRRDSSDRLGLEEMKTALHTDGTLCTNVVRMEVRQEMSCFARSAICRSLAFSFMIRLPLVRPLSRSTTACTMVKY
jgi:hypothetical protein